MKESLDTQWYGQLRTALQPVDESYILLEPTPDVLEEKRKEFEASDFTKDIELFPKREVGEQLSVPYAQLEVLRRQIVTEEPNELVREVYHEFIDETLGNIRLIQAAARQDGAAYERENQYLHGMPDRTVFEDSCDWIRYDVEQTLPNADVRLAKLGGEVLARISDAGGRYTRLLPSEATFRAVRDLHFAPGGLYDRLFGEAGLPKENEITRVVGDVMCRRVLNTIGARHEIVDAPNVTWAVSRDPELLFRPKEYRLYREEFIGLIGHEIGSHIIESINGAKKSLHLLELGLAGFVKGNEGRALIREQVVYPDVETALRLPNAQGLPGWEYAIMKHLSICLAVGYNERPYRFSELYDVLHALYAFWRERRMPGCADNEAFAREQAWFLTVRIMKGTDGRGGCYRKDMVYLEGNAMLWRMAASDPLIIMSGDEGKFNLLDPRHREIMSLLG